MKGLFRKNIEVIISAGNHISLGLMLLCKEFGKGLKGLIRLCHQYPPGFCKAQDDATMQLQTNLILTAGALAPSPPEIEGNISHSFKYSGARSGDSPCLFLSSVQIIFPCRDLRINPSICLAGTFLHVPPLLYRPEF